MDKVTQQNAANAEQSASASEELSGQAEQMDQIVKELAMLVGGSNANNNFNFSKKRKVSKTIRSKQSSTLSNQVFHDIAKNSSVQNKKTSKSQIAIPLEDDDQSGSFDEFNC